MGWSAQGFLWQDARTGIWDKTAWSLDWEVSWLSSKKLKGNFEQGHLGWGGGKHSWIHSTTIWLAVKGQPYATPQGKREWMITVRILYSCHLAENWVARSSTINPGERDEKGEVEDSKGKLWYTSTESFNWNIHSSRHQVLTWAGLSSFSRVKPNKYIIRKSGPWFWGLNIKESCSL